MTSPCWDIGPIIRPAGNGRGLLRAGWGMVPYWLKPDQLGKQPYSTIASRSRSGAASCRRLADMSGKRSTPRSSSLITSRPRPDDAPITTPYDEKKAT